MHKVPLSELTINEVVVNFTEFVVFLNKRVQKDKIGHDALSK